MNRGFRKRFVKLALLILVACALTMSSFQSQTFAQIFKDVPEGHWAYEAVKALVELGVIAGFPDNTFRGNETVSRFQMALFLYRLFQVLNDRISNLRAQISTIERRIVELSGSSLPSPSVINQLSSDLQNLRNRLSTLEKTQADVANKTGELEKRLSGLAENLKNVEDTIRKFQQDVSGKIEKLAKDASDLSTKLVNLEKEKADAFAVDRVQQELANVKRELAQYDKLSNELSTLSSMIKSLEQKIQELLAAPPAASGETIEDGKPVEAIVVLVEKLTKLETMLVEIREDTNALDFDIGKLRTKLDAVASDLQTLKTELDNIVEDVDTVWSEIDELKNKLAKLTVGAPNQISNVTGDIDQRIQIQEIRETLRKLEEALSKVKNETLKEAEESLSRLVIKETEKLRTTLDDVFRRIGEIEKNLSLLASNQIVLELRAEFSQLKAEMQVLKNAVESALTAKKEEPAKPVQEIPRPTDMATVTEHRIVVEIEKVEKIEKKMTEVIQSIAELTKKLETTPPQQMLNELSVLTERVKNIEAELQRRPTSAQVNSLNQSVQRVLSMVLSLSDQVTNLEKKVEHLSKELSSRPTVAMEQYVAVADVNKLDESLERIKNLEENIGKLNIEIAQLATEQADLLKKVRQLDLENVVQEVSELKTKIAKIERAVEGLNYELSTLKSSIAQRTIEQATGVATIVTLPSSEQRGAEFERELSSLKVQVSTLETKLEAFRNEVTTLARNIKNLENALEDAVKKSLQQTPPNQLPVLPQIQPQVQPRSGDSEEDLRELLKRLEALEFTVRKQTGAKVSEVPEPTKEKLDETSAVLEQLEQKVSELSREIDVLKTRLRELKDSRDTRADADIDASALEKSIKETLARIKNLEEGIEKTAQRTEELRNLLDEKAKNIEVRLYRAASITQLKNLWNFLGMRIDLLNSDVRKLKSELDALKKDLSALSERFKELLKVVGETKPLVSISSELTNVLVRVEALEQVYSRVSGEYKALSEYVVKHLEELTARVETIDKNLTSELEDLRKRLGSVESKLGEPALRAEPQGSTADLLELIRKLEKRLELIEGSNIFSDAQRFLSEQTTMREKLEKLDQRLEALDARINRTKTDLELMIDSLARRLGELDELMKNAQTLNKDALAKLATELETLKATVAGAQNENILQLSRQTAQLEKTLADVVEQLAEVRAKISEQQTLSTDLKDRVDTIENKKLPQAEDKVSEELKKLRAENETMRTWLVIIGLGLIGLAIYTLFVGK